jgi:hypothetical protein
LVERLRLSAHKPPEHLRNRDLGTGHLTKSIVAQQE